MSDFNLSALAVRERSVTLFLLVAIAIAGVVAFLRLGRAEDPSFTIKQMTVVTAWPGATAKEMEEQVAEKLEKRMQELRWYDRTETFTRPGLAFTMVVLRDSTPPAEVDEEFYQARKKLGDEAHNLPPGVIGPIVNDEFSDVTFALYALKAKGEPHRLLVREAERLRQRLLHVPGRQEGQHHRRASRKDLRRALARPPGDARRVASGALRRARPPERSHAGRLARSQGPAGLHPARRRDRRPRGHPEHPRRRARPHAQARGHRRGEAGLRGSRDLPDPQRRRADRAARRGHARGLERPGSRRGARGGSGGDQRGDAARHGPLQGHGPVRQHSHGRRRVHGQVLRRPRRGDACQRSQHGMARRHRRRGGGSPDARRRVRRHGGDRQGLRPDHARVVDLGARPLGRRRDHRDRDDGREDGGRLRTRARGGLCLEPHRRAHARRDPGDRDRLHAERLREVGGRRVHEQHVLDRRNRARRLLGRRRRVHALPGGEAAAEHREARGRARGDLRHASLQPLPPGSRFRRFAGSGSSQGAWSAPSSSRSSGMGAVDKQFFPNSDRPEVLVEVQMPYGTSIEQTSAATAKVESWLAAAARSSRS